MYTIHHEEGYPLMLVDTYLAMVAGSVGSNQYRHLYVSKNGRCDVINDGDLACAFFVSSILHLFNLINKGVHTTVSRTEIDMINSGWIKTNEGIPGGVVIWGEKIGDDGSPHKHIGICMNKETAVSNCPVAKSPQMHGINDLVNNIGTAREVFAFYTHPSLS